MAATASRSSSMRRKSARLRSDAVRVGRPGGTGGRDVIVEFPGLGSEQPGKIEHP